MGQDNVDHITSNNYVGEPPAGEPVVPPAPPAGYTALTGILRDGAGEPITGSLVVEVPFAMKTAEPALIPPGSFVILLVSGRPCKDAAGTLPAWLPITATATPAGCYLKLAVKLNHGPTKDLGRIYVADAPETSITAIVSL